MFIQTFLETVQRLSSHNLIRQTIPVIYDSLAEKILSAYFLKPGLNNFMLLPLRLVNVAFLKKTDASMFYLPVSILYVSIRSPLLLYCRVYRPSLCNLSSYSRCLVHIPSLLLFSGPSQGIISLLFYRDFTQYARA